MRHGTFEHKSHRSTEQAIIALLRIVLRLSSGIPDSPRFLVEAIRSPRSEAFQQSLDVRYNHVQCYLVVATFRDDYVGVALAWLDEFQVHGRTVVRYCSTTESSERPRSFMSRMSRRMKRMSELASTKILTSNNSRSRAPRKSECPRPGSPAPARPAAFRGSEYGCESHTPESRRLAAAQLLQVFDKQRGFERVGWSKLSRLRSAKGNWTRRSSTSRLDQRRSDSSPPFRELSGPPSSCPIPYRPLHR